MYDKYRFYTIQKYGSKDIKIKKIKKEIFDYKLDYILKLLVETLSRHLTLNEIYFYLIFKAKGWTVITLPINTRNVAKCLILRDLEKQFDIDTNAITSKNGCPDFIIFKNNIFEFIEVKKGKDKLSKKQTDWIKKYKHTVYIVKPAKKLNPAGNRISDERIFEMYGI